MQDLTVTFIQTALIWEDIDANLAMLTTKLRTISTPTDLVVLPEMFSTGFTLAAPQLAETMSGKAVSWLKANAARSDAAIAGSLIIVEENHYYNRLVCCFPDGRFTVYDKRHLFRYAGEEKVFSAGRGHGDILIKGWRIRPFICYDLRFPVWIRNLTPAYDLALFVANWPAARAAHWKALLLARAIENQAYVLGVNRIGRDGKGIDYSGDSMVVTAQGEILAAGGDGETIKTITLSRSQLENYRANFPAWMDTDHDLIHRT